MINNSYKKLDFDGEIDLTYLNGKVKGFSDEKGNSKFYTRAVGFVDDLEHAKLLISELVDDKTIICYAYLTNGSDNMEEKSFLTIRSNIK
jgi:hypothetical protein